MNDDPPASLETGSDSGSATEGGKRSMWMSHVKSVMRSNKGKSLKQVLKMAAKSYKKGAKTVKKSKSKSKKGPFGLYGGGSGLYGGKKGKKTRRNSRK